MQLANTYFDAEKYADAIKWYEASLQIEPANPDASTDLGVSYYYLGQIDRALQQFDASLKLDPKHTKTMLNQGIVLAFGKQDLAGAQVVKRIPVHHPQETVLRMTREQHPHPGRKRLRRAARQHFCDHPIFHRLNDDRELTFPGDRRLHVRVGDDLHRHVVGHPHEVDRIQRRVAAALNRRRAAANEDH